MRFSKLIALILAFAGSASIAPAAAEDKGTVLVTGANRGIGLELARQYAAEGWQVIGTARRPDAATELRETGARVVQLDVTDPDSVMGMADELAGEPIDILINNAGILPAMSTLAAIDFEDYERVLAVNTIGPVRVTQALMPNLRAGNLKKIVGISSGAGSIEGNTSGGLYGYRESKAALNMFTRSVASELGPEGYTCIVMNPGWVQTDMGGPNAFVKVQDSAAGLRAVINKVSPADNGTFWTFQGEQQAW